MPRILAVVPFQSSDGHQYVYDDNTGMVFPAAAATVALLREHADRDLDAAAASVSRAFQPEAVADAVDFVRRWETHYGAFYRPPAPPVALSERAPTAAEVESAAGELGFRHLLLVLTNDCNLRCRYCFYSSSYPLSRDRSAQTMSVDTGRRAIDYFAERARPAIRRNPTWTLAVSFYGGEPLLRFDTLVQLVRHARDTIDCPLVFAVTTNGTLLGGEVAEYLVSNDFQILVSLDGPRDDHDRNRIFAGGRGSFDVVTENLRRFHDRYQDYRKIHLIAVGDWKTDVRRAAAFFSENASWLPPLQLYSRVVARETTYYDQFSEVDRSASQEAHRDLQDQYLARLAAGADGDQFTRAYFGRTVAQVVYRRRQYNGRPSFLPFGNTCLPGMKLAVRVDGTFDICERVNGTMPIGDVDRGLDYGRIASIVREYNEKVCAQCWSCPVTRLCYQCFAFRDRDGTFSDASEAPGACLKCQEDVRNLLSLSYSVLERNPDACPAQAVSPEVKFLTS
jgi:uncharacterized protein